MLGVNNTPRAISMYSKYLKNYFKVWCNVVPTMGPILIMKLCGNYANINNFLSLRDIPHFHFPPYTLKITLMIEALEVKVCE